VVKSQKFPQKSCYSSWLKLWLSYRRYEAYYSHKRLHTKFAFFIVHVSGNICQYFQEITKDFLPKTICCHINQLNRMLSHLPLQNFSLLHSILQSQGGSLVWCRFKKSTQIIQISRIQFTGQVEGLWPCEPTFISLRIAVYSMGNRSSLFTNQLKFWRMSIQTDLAAEKDRASFVF
jgi:hypothetical protein